MNRKPIEYLYTEVKQKIIVALNESGLPPAMMDSLLCMVLADIRAQSNLELLNYAHSLQKQLEEIQKQDNDTGKAEIEKR